MRAVIFPRSIFMFWKVGFCAARTRCILACLPRWSKLESMLVNSFDMSFPAPIKRAGNSSITSTNLGSRLNSAGLSCSSAMRCSISAARVVRTYSAFARFWTMGHERCGIPSKGIRSFAPTSIRIKLTFDGDLLLAILVINACKPIDLPDPVEPPKSRWRSVARSTMTISPNTLCPTA